MLRLCKVWMVCGLLMLGACSSTTFVYNRLDFLLPWYVNDYAELTSEQETYLDELLAPFLVWHRNQELPTYLTILGNIEGRLDQPFTPAVVAAVFADFEAAWLRLEGESLEWLLALGGQMSDEQIAEFIGALWEQQEEREEEFLERTDEEYYEDSYDNMLDIAKDYLGSVSDAQRDLLRKDSRRLQRSDNAWLRENAEWIDKLTILLERKPGWQENVRAAVVARREQLSLEYRGVYEHNVGVIYDVIVMLLNDRSERQDKHLRSTLSELRSDVQTLIAEGK